MSRHVASGAVTALAIACSLLLLASACGKLPPPPDPVRARALILNNQADGEIERGNLAEAERLYGEALSAARSIEDETRIAVNLLGLAATMRAAGRGKEAGPLLDELLGSSTRRFPAELVAQASLQKAVIALDEERPADAAASVQRSLSDCARPRSCSQVATAHVLMARARLALGEPAGAAAEAKSGLDVARSRRDLREEANALRLLGDAALALGGAQEALARYDDALALDKELGFSRKVAADLLGLAAASHRLRRTAEARAFAERALAVCTAAGDERLATRARELIAAGGGVEAKGPPAAPSRDPIR
jgi:tetratricopeptide (TPR) repeat protein